MLLPHEPELEQQHLQQGSQQQLELSNIGVASLFNLSASAVVLTAAVVVIVAVVIVHKK